MFQIAGMLCMLRPKTRTIIKRPHPRDTRCRSIFSDTINPNIATKITTANICATVMSYLPPLYIFCLYNFASRDGTTQFRPGLLLYYKKTRLNMAKTYKLFLHFSTADCI